ncbi:MAG: crotonase/enoyl-CoA hydratase family protein [Pseudomonadota bacterium]
MNSVKYALEEGVATISMDDGRANIMTAELLRDLTTALERARADKVAVLLRSDLPNTYSAGFDLKMFAARDAERSLEMVKAGGELIEAMVSFPGPIVAVAQGHVFPMGLFTILAADYRIGADTGYQWGLNEVKIGIVPPLYAFKLIEARLRRNWCHRTLMSGEMYSPREALDAGVFDELVPVLECDARARAVTAQLAGNPREAFSGIKKRLKSNLAADLRSAISSEQTLAHYKDQLHTDR